MKTVSVLRLWTRRFACAWRGLWKMLREEPSGRAHLAGLALVAGLGIALRVSSGEWAVLALAAGGVIAAEGLNTAIERLADRVSLEREESIRNIKDLSAGGVLAAALGAAGAGLCVFGPKLLALMHARGS